MKINWQNVTEQALGTLLATIVIGAVTWVVVQISAPGSNQSIAWVALAALAVIALLVFLRGWLGKLGVLIIRLVRFLLMYWLHVFTVAAFIAICVSVYFIYGDLRALGLIIASTALLIISLHVWALDNPRLRSYDRTQGEVKVWADQEAGVRTNIFVHKGDTVEIMATGTISIDAGHTFLNPDGMVTSQEGRGLDQPAIILSGDTLLFGDQRAGILIGWIGKYSRERAFKVGSNNKFVSKNKGELYLAVNDMLGAYRDNIDGNGRATFFTATIRVTRHG